VGTGQGGCYTVAVSVEPIDPATAGAADLAGCHAARAAHVALELPGDPVPSLADTTALLAANSAEERRLVRVVRDGGTVAGFGYLLLPDKHNTGVGLLWGWIHPDHRRRGHGSALLADAVQVLRSEGRRALLIEALAGSPAQPFTERFGFDVGQREVISRLDLSTLDVGRLTAAAAAGHPPYQLQSWRGPVPEHLLERYATALNGMLDAPVGDLPYESPPWTPERLRDWESWLDQRDRDMLATVAVHEPSGEIAGLTLLLLPRTPNGRAYQDDTTVVRAHRGSGLGLWIKAANALRLVAEHPEVRDVITGNAEENLHMRRINTDLGFRVLRVIEERTASVDDLARQLER
jgi:mycothiol synthase